MERIRKDLIAPCGMNCAICRGHLREKNQCPGCRNNPTIPSCSNCRLRLCENKEDYCFECDKFPCVRLKQLDKRYREKYGLSEIENLEYIRQHGIDAFVQNEKRKWQEKDGILCCHDRKVYPDDPNN